MAMSVRGLRADQGDSVFYDPGFRAVIEDHRVYLQNKDPDIRIIPNGDALRWRYDFYGLLSYMDIPEYLHWIILRVNNLLSPSDYNESLTTVIIPSIKVIQNLSSIYRNTMAN